MDNKEDYKKKYEELNKKFNEFVYIISHDMNTPLRGITSLVTFLNEELNEEELNKEEIEKLLSLLNDNTSQMQLMLQALLDISRVNTINQEKSEVDFNNLIVSSYLELGADNHFELDVKNNLPKLEMNVQDAAKVLKIVLENVILHCEAENPVLSVSSIDTDESVKIVFRDNGEPIKPQHRQLIWQLFRTVKGHQDKHIGKGLTLLMALMEKYNGKAFLNENDTGNTFVLEFLR